MKVRVIATAARLVFLLAPVLAASCTDRENPAARGAERKAAAPVTAGDLVAVSHPDLSGVSDDLRDQIAELRSLVESPAGAENPTTLGQAWGDLARAYHAYGFLDAAAAAYENARKLQPEVSAWPYLAGLVELDRGRHQVAVERFREALAIDPRSAVAQLRLGETLLVLGETDAATVELEAASKSPEYAAAALAALGRAARDRGDAARALALFQQALAAQPSADLLHHSIAAAYKSLGDEARAEEELAQAGTKPPEYPDPAADGLDQLRTTTGALLLRGNRALVAEHPQEAIEQYRRAVAAAPDDAEARRTLALALRQTGDLDGALTELTEAARLAPENHLVLFDLGNLQLARGAHQAAADALAASLAIAPDFVPARFNLANAQLLIGEADKALANLERVLELDPGHRRARYQAAVAKGALGRGPEAIRDLEAMLEEDPGYGPALLGLADLYERGGDRARARDAYQQVLSKSDDVSFQVEGHLGLARLAKAEGRPPVEITELQAAVALAPSRDDLREQLARELETAERYQEAAEQRRALVELRPDAVMERMLEASTWVEAGRSDVARQRLEEGVERHPDQAMLANTLARLLATAREPEVRDGARALEIARSLYARTQSPDIAETLAMALAAAGDFKQAAAVQRTLIEQVRSAGQTSHLPRLEDNLRRFERGEPVRM